MTESQPVLTVLIPVFNGETLIRSCVSSVLEQPCKDLQVLILDDGSTDKTKDICEAIAERDNRVTVMSHENYGLGRNRNEGFPFIKGKYTIFLDHDDFLVPNFYSELFKSFLQDCFRKGIDTIVPARLRCNSAATLGFKEVNHISGLYSGNSMLSWKVKYEFSTLIYATENLQRHAIFFSETRPEMESIFRHKAVLMSNKVLFTDELYFAVRRDNSMQITKNWNQAEVSKVRMQEYSKLLGWYDNLSISSDVRKKCRKILASTEKEYVYQVARSIGTVDLQHLDDIPDTGLLDKMSKVLLETNRHGKLVRLTMLTMIEVRRSLDKLTKGAIKYLYMCAHLRQLDSLFLSSEQYEKTIRGLRTIIQNE